MPPYGYGDTFQTPKSRRRGGGGRPPEMQNAKKIKIYENLSTVSFPGASNRQNRETEVVPIEDISFFQCFRQLIESWRLSPERSETQLTEILRRVEETRAAGPSAGGRQSADPIQTGGARA